MIYNPPNLVRRRPLNDMIYYGLVFMPYDLTGLRIRNIIFRTSDRIVNSTHNHTVYLIPHADRGTMRSIQSRIERVNKAKCKTKLYALTVTLEHALEDMGVSEQ